MEVLFSEDKKRWDDFLLKNNGSFLQSWDFGRIEKEQKKKIWRLFVERDGDILAEAQVRKEIFPMKKSLLYIPYGPCFRSNLFLKDKKKILSMIFRKVENIGRKENAVFLNIEPDATLPEMDNLLNSERRVQPQKTLILPLDKPQEGIFKSFHQKTRYNIRLAEKRGVKIMSYRSKEKINKLNFFWKLLQKTSKRGKFKGFSKNHYRLLLSLDSTILYTAEYKDKIIAANILVYFGDCVSYIHGASDYKYRKFMAPHLLHWRQICESKNSGMKKYDFWGIDEKEWPGITRFKKGFGGEELIYPKGKNLVLQKFWYRAYQLMRRIVKFN